MRFRHLSIFAISVFMALMAIPSSYASEPALVRVRLGKSGKVWVGQRVPLYVELRTTTLFSGTPKFDLPKISGTIFLKVEGRPLLGTKKVGDVSYITQQHEFALFLQRAGSFVIPPFKVRFSVSEKPGKKGVEHLLTTQKLQLASQMPPGAENLSNLISTRKLMIKQSWNSEPKEAIVGDAFTRTITMEAPDIPGMAFPQIPFPKASGLGIYPKPPSVQDRMKRGDFIGKRVETVTFVFEKPGTYKIPSLVIPWFDLKEKKLKRIKLPGRTIEVSPNSALAPTKGKEEVTEAQSSEFQNWWWLVSIAIASSVCGILFWYRRALFSRWQNWRNSYEQREPAYFNRLKKACRSNDPVATLNALMRWLECLNSDRESATVADFLSSQDDLDLTQELENVQRACLYPDDVWEGGRLAIALGRARKNLLPPHGGSQSPTLPPLNPGEYESVRN